MTDHNRNKPRRKTSGSTINSAKKPGAYNRKADIQLSKSLSWVLRHAAPSLGLKLAPDGFVPVEHVLALDHPRFRKGKGQPKYTVEDVVLVVKRNDKQRFRLEYKDDYLREDSALKNDTTIGNDRADINLGDDDGNIGRISAVKSCGDQEMKTNESSTEEGVSQNNKVLCIRANQGHSLKGLQSDQLLTPLTKEELTHPDLTIVHGTTCRAWKDHIQHEGLSRMKRNHIHFATGLPPSAAAKKNQNYENQKNSTTPLSGMRSSSEIYIYINGSRCADDDIPFYRSDNGVVLTAGANEEGILPMQYFERVIDAFSEEVLWKSGGTTK